MPKILVIEDEPISASGIVQTLAALGHEVLKAVYNINHAMQAIIDFEPDVVLLNLNLEHSTSRMDIAVQIRHSHGLPVVLLSATPDKLRNENNSRTHQVTTSKKAICKETLHATVETAALERCRNEVEALDKPLSTSAKHIFCKKGNQHVRVALNDIVWIEALDNYVILHTTKDCYMVHATLKRMEKFLAPLDFIKVHRSYLVRFDKIEAYCDGDIVVGGKAISIGRTFRDAVMQRLTFI